jgi:hypothetical protein
VQEESNKTSKKNITEWIIASLCLIAGWLLLGWHVQTIYLFCSTLFIPFILCGIFLGVPNKYLIPATYLLVTVYCTIIKLIIGNASSPFEDGFLLLDFFFFFFVSFLVFSITIIKKEKSENKKARKEAILKKTLGLIFFLLLIATMNCIIFIHISQ